ncbi:MAG: hypothetical protein WDN30_13040 [Pararobbsia sp.]
MEKKLQGRARTPAEIEYDFIELLASRLPTDVAKREFEILWDESNAALIARLGTAEGEHYLDLLRACMRDSSRSMAIRRAAAADAAASERGPAYRGAMAWQARLVSLTIANRAIRMGDRDGSVERRPASLGDRVRLQSTSKKKRHP